MKAREMEKAKVKEGVSGLNEKRILIFLLELYLVNFNLVPLVGLAIVTPGQGLRERGRCLP